MKKILAILLTILLISIAFISCNLDGTSGILWSVASSKSPLEMRYKQLLGKDDTYLYFMTEKGIERVTSPSANTRIVSSKDEYIIQAAALWNATPGSEKVFYTTNNEADQDANKINVIDVTGPVFVSSSIYPDSTNIPDIKRIKLLANSNILVLGEASGKIVFELQDYNGTAFPTSTSLLTTTLSADDYELHAVIQQTGMEQEANAPLIISFVESSSSGSGTYQHYLVDPTSPALEPIMEFNSKTIANFVVSGTADNVYILTTDGILYYAGTLADPTQKVEMKDSGSTYSKNAFVYAVDDSANYHLITKPSLTSSSLEVFSFAHAVISSTGVTETSVKSGYAKELALVDIVSAQVKATSATVSTLYVATDVNGMYEISITHINANKDNDTNGDSSGAEEYTL